MKITNLLVTGGAGFIGSNFIGYLFEQADFSGRIINLDKLTYAGNLMNLDSVERDFGGHRYFFEKADICDCEAVAGIIRKYDLDTVVHFAAESHVDRSIDGPKDFVQTNVNGTFAPLEAVRQAAGDGREIRFHHVSTDEVYGSLGATGAFREDTAYDPRSPYSASKAASDHLVRAYFHTYGLPVTISNCSNNYGPYQFPEKLIPLMILNILAGKALPVYGDGRNVRDWLYVRDHCRAVWQILRHGRVGETYNIGGENEWTNLDLVNRLCEKVAGKTGDSENRFKSLINFVKDRPGHDRRYAIDCGKIKKELGWSRTVDFDQGLDLTIDWYLANRDWVEKVQSGDYRSWIARNYTSRPGI